MGEETGPFFLDFFPFDMNELCGSGLISFSESFLSSGLSLGMFSYYFPVGGLFIVGLLFYSTAGSCLIVVGVFFY